MEIATYHGKFEEDRNSMEMYENKTEIMWNGRKFYQN